MQRIAVIFLLAIHVCNSGFSQQYPFVHYTPKDGLVNNRARFMFQDSKGLLYIATYSGLSVYDGSRFTNYTANDGLFSPMVNDIVEMGDDSIWIITNTSKINCLTKGRIKDVTTSDGFFPGVDKMIKGSDGFYYAAASEGLFRLEKNHFSRIPLIDDSGRNVTGFFSQVTEIKNKLFIITDPNMQPLAQPGRIIVYDLLKHKVAVSKSIFAYQVTLSPKGDILVSTTSGLKKMEEDALEQNQIRLVEAPAIYHSAENIVVGDVYFDRQQNFWICSNNGVVCIDSLGKLKTFTRENGLTTNAQTSVFQDKENTIWFINEQTGISKLTNQNLEFHAQISPGFSTQDIYTNSNTDSVWFLDPTSNKLLVQFGKKEKEFKLEPHAYGMPYHFFISQKNKNYLTDLFHIYEFDLADGKMRNRVSAFTDTTRDTNLGLSCIVGDGFDNLVTCNDKLVVLLNNNKIISYPLGYFADQVSITADKHLWVINREGKLFEFRIHPDNPDHYLELIKIFHKELPVMNPRSIIADKEGNVWIGSRDRGLFCFFFDSLSLRSWKKVTTSEGLSDNFVSYLYVDENNSIWACSPGGLDKVDLKDGKIIIENITLGSNQYQRIGKALTSRNGVCWALSGTGLIKVAPVKDLPNNFQPKIIFREIKEGTKRIDEARPPSPFSYQENNISFSVAVPSFIDEKQVRFSYLLEGTRNKNWSDPSSQGSIDLVNLSSGKYVFRARAIFLNHRYPDSEIFFSFVILPPWWQTWWFRSILSLLFGFIIWLFIRSYYKRKLYQQRMSLEKQQAVEKERTRIAADMHDDLGAGLSTIRFLSEKVKRNSFSEVTRDDIEKMQFTSNELIDKMNEIIWAMNEKNDSLEDLIFYTRSYAMEYCGENNLECGFHLPENIPAYPLSGEIRRNIFLTVKESLHNVVKHASAKKVEITMTTLKSLDITIQDNGRGLNKKDNGETGNGLRNMQKRIESIGGTLMIQNENGVTVSLHVPLG
jgi:signal transduction histidine kinase/ligand-binding sensor domain-containing protein